MRPEEAARRIQIGLDTRYMVLASAATPGKIMNVCPARCALAKDMRQRRPDLVVGVYETDVTAEEIRRDLVAVRRQKRERLCPGRTIT